MKASPEPEIAAGGGDRASGGSNVIDRLGKRERSVAGSEPVGGEEGDGVTTAAGDRPKKKKRKGKSKGEAKHKTSFAARQRETRREEKAAAAAAGGS